MCVGAVWVPQACSRSLNLHFAKQAGRHKPPPEINIEDRRATMPRRRFPTAQRHYPRPAHPSDKPRPCSSSSVPKLVMPSWQGRHHSDLPLRSMRTEVKRRDHCLTRLVDQRSRKNSTAQSGANRTHLLRPYCGHQLFTASKRRPS